MKKNLEKAAWQDWLKFRRLIPLVTVLFALGVGVLSLFQYFQPTRAEGIIVILLALLAMDALVERISLLEKIETTLSSLKYSNQFRDRSDLINIREMGMSATEIAAAGPTLVQLLTPNDDFWSERLREGCNLRFVLLDPASNAWEVWHQGQIAPPRSDIDSSLVILGRLMGLKGVKGKCEVKLSPTYLHFSLVMTDPKKSSGRMNVEILALKVSLHSRPHVHLTKDESEKWFDFFNDQFQTHWESPKNKTLGLNDNGQVIDRETKSIIARIPELN